MIYHLCHKCTTLVN